MNELEKKAQDTGLVSSNRIVGVEGLGGRHLSIGNIVLVQALSSHFTEKGVRVGAIANSLTGAEVANTQFVPAYLTEKLFVYKYKDEACTQKEFAFVAEDEFDKRLNGLRMNWEDGKKPEVIPTIILAAIMGGKPVKVSFRGTSGYPAGQKLFTFVYDAANEEKKALWGVKYKLLSLSRVNKKGQKYYAFDIEKVGDPTPEESAQAAALYDAFKSQVQLTDD
jgi:hypothetical protein